MSKNKKAKIANEQEIKIRVTWGKKENRDDIIDALFEEIQTFNFIKSFHISSDGKERFVNNK